MLFCMHDIKFTNADCDRLSGRCQTKGAGKRNSRLKKKLPPNGDPTTLFQPHLLDDEANSTPRSRKYVDTIRPYKDATFEDTPVTAVIGSIPYIVGLRDLLYSDSRTLCGRLIQTSQCFARPHFADPRNQMRSVPCLHRHARTSTRHA